MKFWYNMRQENQDNMDVHIALAANDPYFDGLLVTASSIAHYADANTTLVFHIVDGGISNANFNALENAIKAQHSDVKIERRIVTEKEGSRFPSYHGSWMPFARLLLPRLLPDVDKVVYCDVDFLWLADVTKLWNRCNEYVPIHSTIDGFAYTERIERKWFTERRLRFPKNGYFCSGLCVFNLKIFREERLDDEIFAFMQDHPDVNFADQTALNALLGERTVLIEKRWQLAPRMLEPEEFVRPCVLHYSGEAPWKVSRETKMFTDAQMLWFDVLAILRNTTRGEEIGKCYSRYEIAVYRILFLFVMHFPFAYTAFRIFMKCRKCGGHFREVIRRDQYCSLVESFK